MARRVALVLGLLLGAASAGEKELTRIEKLERRMARLVNRDRAKHKLPPLAWHDGLAAIARAHSEDMRDHGFFAHESPRTGKVKDRAAEAGIPHRGVAENIAGGATIEASQRALMKSPGHRANILSPIFTHVGIGIAERPGGWPLVTQVFIRDVPHHDPKDLRKAILEGLERERRKRGLRHLVEDDRLSRAAQAHSDHAVFTGKPDPMWLEDILARDGSRWTIHEVQYLLTDKASDAFLSETALSARYDHFGVGVAVTPAKSKTAGAAWVTFIAAQRRLGRK